METMERQAVRSRDIAVIGYDSSTSILEITFRIGGVYHYSGVPKAIYQNLLTAPSQGKYFEQNIKYQFPYIKIY